MFLSVHVLQYGGKLFEELLTFWYTKVEVEETVNCTPEDCTPLLGVCSWLFAKVFFPFSSISKSNFLLSILLTIFLVLLIDDKNKWMLQLQFRLCYYRRIISTWTYFITNSYVIDSNVSSEGWSCDTLESNLIKAKSFNWKLCTVTVYCKWMYNAMSPEVFQSTWCMMQVLIIILLIVIVVPLFCLSVCLSVSFLLSLFAVD